jgi:hypothetical protein
MLKRILLIGTLLTVLAAASLMVLSILDLISKEELFTTMGRTVSAIAVMTAAAMAVGVVVRIGKKA